MTGDDAMGLLEIAVLGGVGWIVIYTVIVFLQAALYAALTCSTAFGCYFVLAEADTSQAAYIFNLGDYGISSIELVAVLLLLASWKFLMRFFSCFRGAVNRYFSAFGIAWD